MAVDARSAGSPLAGARRRLSSEFWRRPWLKAALLLAPPLAGFFGEFAVAAELVRSGLGWLLGAGLLRTAEDLP